MQEGAGFVGVAPAHGDEFGSGGIGDGAGMEIGDEAESDDAEAERCGRCHEA